MHLSVVQFLPGSLLQETHKMKLNVMFLVILVLWCSQTRETLAVMRTILKVLKFGTDISSFFGNLFQGNSDPDGTQEIIDTISRRIEQSTKTIVFELKLQAHISELRETALTIKSLLQMVKNIATETNLDDRKQFEDRFRSAFDQGRNLVYKIKYLLTFTVPVEGISSTLLDRVSDKTKCKVPVLEEFRDYYMTLVSDAIGLDILYEELDGGAIINQVTKTWTYDSKELFDSFDDKINQCKNQTTAGETNASTRTMAIPFVVWICLEVMLVQIRDIFHFC